MTFRRLYIFAVLLAFLFPAVLRAQDAELVDIVQMFENQDLEGARSKCAALVKAYPDYDAAYYYMGMCDLLLNKPELAQDELKTAVSLSPGNYWYRDRLAVAYSATGDDAMVEDTYEKIIEDFPKQTDVYYSLVNLYLRNNQLDKALGAMDNIESFAGKSEQISLTRYEILMHQNKTEEARKSLEAFNEDYASVQVSTYLGDHHLAEYEDSLALGYYQEALALDKDYAPALLGRSEVYRIRRDYPNYFVSMQDFVSSQSILPSDKAGYLSALLQQADGRFIQNFKKDLDDLYSTCVSMHSQDSTILQGAAVYYYRTGRNDAAIDVLERNVELYPRSIAATATYLQVLGLSDEWERLRDESRKAIGRFPEEVALYDFWTSACYSMNDYQGVIDANMDVLAKFPNDTSKTIPAMSTIGDMYHQMNQPAKAYKMYDKVLKLRRDYAPVLNNYAYYLSMEGKKLSKAAGMAKICIEKEPDNATYLDTYGWILYLQGKASEAKSHFKHAMLYGGKDSAVIMDHYAEVLYILGEYDLARVYWKQAKDKNTDGSIPDLDERVAKRLEKID